MFWTRAILWKIIKVLVYLIGMIRYYPARKKKYFFCPYLTRPHMFRHSFATYLIEEGVDVSCVQQILGHSSIKTTQIYIHIAAKKQADILRELHPRNNMKIVNVA